MVELIKRVFKQTCDSAFSGKLSQSYSEIDTCLIEDIANCVKAKDPEYYNLKQKEYDRKRI